ncbi:MAG: ATP-binding cassette domain-containing protein, partial [Candidatus Ratteibacteria bacterium]|nr:ATP-binding cassette domain-containing protein [Candidatus Ratteibacteria bacterium]
MEKILEVKELVTGFRDISGGSIEILRKVNFSINKNQSLSLVGESGSGKTITARTIMGLLLENMYVKSGEVFLCGQDILRMGKGALRRIRGNRAGMIFQEPSSHLNPVFTAGSQVY